MDASPIWAGAAATHQLAKHGTLGHCCRLMSVTGESVFCMSCGTSIRSSARFCENCGAPQDVCAPGDPADAETVIEAEEATARTARVDLMKPPADAAPGRLWAGEPPPSAPAEPPPAPTPPRAAAPPTPPPAAAPPAPPTPPPAPAPPTPPPAPGTATTDPSEAFCGKCGRAYAPGSQFCVGCGAKRGTPSAPMPPPAPPAQTPGAPPSSVADEAGTRTAQWQTSLPSPFNAVPRELLAVCALMTIAGLLVLYRAIRVSPDIVELLNESGFARQIGLLLLTVWALLALAGGALILLARKIADGDHVARGLAYVLLGGLGGAILIGSEHQTELVLAMLACVAAGALLALAPRAQEFFAGAAAPDGEQPAAIVLARTLVALWAGIVIFIGVMFLPLSDLDGKFVPIGVLFIALGSTAWYYNGRLAKGDPAARALMTIGAGVYLVLLLILGERQPGLILPLALAAGLVFNLWVPKEAQPYFTRG